MPSIRRTRRFGLASQVFIGLFLGIIVGVFFGEEVAFLKIGGDAFIALLQITVIPYVVVALITSLGRLSLDDAKSLGVKAGSVLLALWTVGLLVVLVSPLALPDWPSGSFFTTSQVEEAKPVDFLRLYVPANIFSSLSNAVVPAIVVFSILFGVGLISVARKERILDLLCTVGDTLMAITGFVGKLAPYGVFAITASAAGTIDVADLGRLQVYIVLYIVMALILSFWLIPGLIAALTPLSYGAILRAFRGPLITAFATGNVLIVLPILAADSKELLARADEYSDHPSKIEESSIDILIPAAYPFPNLGSILALMFVLFGGWYVGSSVAIADYPSLSVAGMASLFGGTVLALPFLFDLLRLPADLFQVFVAVDVIGSRFGTLLAAMHIIGIALIGTYALQGAVRLSVVPLFRFGILSLVILGVALLGIRAFYTYVYVVPYTKDQLLTSLHLIDNPRPHIVHSQPPESIPDHAGGRTAFERIKVQRVLRACYATDDYPSAFLNSNGELVGFDIALTHDLAGYLDVSVEFMPIADADDAEERISTGYCDILMALTVIAPQSTEKFAMTEPVRHAAVGLVVEDHRRQAFQTWSGVAGIEGLRIAISSSRAAREFISRTLPQSEPVVYERKAELAQILRNGSVDAVLDTAEEGAAWTILNPRYSLVIPTPTQLVPLGYAVAKGETDLLIYLDTWLLNARTSGKLDEIYRYWMLGEVKKTQPPRWSVIRNVLGWID